MALAGMCLVSTPANQAHGQTIQIQDPAEFNSYQNATTQNDPAQKCAALESFLKTYPQSTAKSAALARRSPNCPPMFPAECAMRSWRPRDNTLPTTASYASATRPSVSARTPSWKPFAPHWKCAVSVVVK